MDAKFIVDLTPMTCIASVKSYLSHLCVNGKPMSLMIELKQETGFCASSLKDAENKRKKQRRKSQKSLAMMYNPK